MPKVSVIIPTYNRAKYISEAINSVLNQSFKDFEIIVVDDGSTDNTRAILEPYLCKIKYCYQKNSGPAKARNEGIKIAKGEYIGFLDSDDLWLPEKLKFQMDFFTQFPNIEILHCNLEFLKEGEILGFNFNKIGLIKGGYIFNDLLLLKGDIFMPCVIIKRAILDEIGLFNESLHTAEDTNMFLRIAKKYYFGFIDKILVRIRIHQDNLTTIGIKNYGTIKNLDHISSLFPELHPSRSKLMRKAYERRYKFIGHSLFLKSDYAKAREFFIEAIRINFFNFEIIILLSLTFIPKNILDYMRVKKRIFFKRH